MSWVGINPVQMSRSVHTVQCAPILNIYTGFIPTQLMKNTSGCCYSS